MLIVIPSICCFLFRLPTSTRFCVKLLAIRANCSSFLCTAANHPTIVMLEKKMSEQMFSCLQCNFKSSRPSHLRNHLMNKHAFKKATETNEVASKLSVVAQPESREEKPGYKCDQCDHVATKKMSLKLHVQVKHEGLRFPCDHCD